MERDETLKPCPATPGDEEKAREIAREVIVAHLGSQHPAARHLERGAAKPIAAALAEARREALEEAARWHEAQMVECRKRADEQRAARRYEDAMRAETLFADHARSATAIRALLPQQGGDRG